MHSLFYKLAAHGARRIQPAEEIPAEEFQLRVARRARTFRYGLLAVLLVVGSAAFVEVVLLPGKLVRQRISSQAITPTEELAPAQQGVLAPELVFASEQYRNREPDVQRKRLESQLRTANLRLDDAIVAADNQLQRSRSYFAAKLQMGPDQPNNVPQPVAAAVAGEPSGASAWNDIREVWAEAETSIGNARSLRSLEAERFTDDSFLAADDKELEAAIQRIHAVTIHLKRTYSDIDHLSILVTARAALARTMYNPQPIGDTP